MTNNSIPLDKVIWRKVRYLKTPWQATDEEAIWEYELVLPEPLAKWDVFSIWERERTLSIREHLRPGDTLFDVGVEHGWLSVAYAQTVGGENMVLMEPTQEFWPNIRRTWEKNNLVNPKGCWAGLVSDAATLDTVKARHWSVWPLAAEVSMLAPGMAYTYLHESHNNIPEISIDNYVSLTGIVPKAITIDCEGAEPVILRGAKQTLLSYHPKLWLSVHEDLMLRDYNTSLEHLISMLHAYGYQEQHLKTDHEAHYYCP